MRRAGSIHIIVLGIITIFTMMGCNKGSNETVDSQKAVTTQAEKYDATIRWTPYGIPHVKANDWGSLGYGFAYAVAEDAICVLAEEIVTVNGERAKFFGPANNNVESDAFNKALLNQAALDHSLEGQRSELVELSNGYVEGYNRYLADHKGKLPGSCNGKPWVRPMTQDDMTRIGIGVGIRYGLGYFMEQIVNATPPETTATSASKSPVQKSDPATALLPDRNQMGSNAYALGKSVTANGRGMLLGNPHYPWQGPSRFHMAHLTIPGELNVMGVGLYTTSIIALGFTEFVAWSHTVSSALRFTIFELSLVEGNPLAYRYGNETRNLVPSKISIEVQGKDGNLITVDRTIYMSHYGPLIESKDTPWTLKHAYVIKDVNYKNNRSGEQYYRIMRAKSIEDIADALKKVQGVAWVNTIAADRHGTAFYGDLSAIPNVDKKLIDTCKSANVERISGRPMVVLDGSRPDCGWQVDEGAVAPGIMPPTKLPSLSTDSYVTNSNDSYWLSNPDERLEGYSPIIGNEGTTRSLRTRAGLKFIEEVLSSDGTNKFTPEILQDIMYNHRNYGAEIFLDDVLTICKEEPKEVKTKDTEVDVGKACGILESWDRRQDLESRGAQIYTEFWRHARSIENLFAVPFDINDPVNTPRGIKKTDTNVRKRVMDALGNAVKTLKDGGIPLDAPWGEVQFVVRNGEKIGIPGGLGDMGMFSNIYAPFKKGEGYTPVVTGNSYIQVVTWDDTGNPDVRAILTYSQSPELESPHYADQTRLYSKGQWIKLPFTEEQITQKQVKSIRLMSQ